MYYSTSQTSRNSRVAEAAFVSVDEAVGVDGADEAVGDVEPMREAAAILARGEKAGFSHGEEVMGGEEAIPEEKASLRFNPGGLLQDGDEVVDGETLEVVMELGEIG